MSSPEVRGARARLPTAVTVGGLHSRMHILGVPVDIVDMRELVATVVRWCAERRTRVVFVRDVHGLMRAVDDPNLREMHFRADLVVPDGTPLVWIGRLRGHGARIGRTCGPDIVDEVCAATAGSAVRHFFYGGKPGVAEEMARRLAQRYPGLEVAGTFTPGFGDTTPEARAAEIAAIRAAEPHIVWVGMSTPKQEAWMMQCGPEIPAVLFGVGAAFDFHAGMVKRAPLWMQENGLEWLHRLLSEPRRLWYRYLVLAPRFVVGAVGEQARRVFVVGGSFD